MKKSALFLHLFAMACLVLTCACKKDEDVPPEEPNRISVVPKVIDAGYDNGEDSHVAFYNAEINLNKLLLFIGGSYSNPKNYETICEHARQQGFHVISLSYPNNIAAASLSDDENIMAFDQYRDEICYGNPVSDDVDVNHLTSTSSLTGLP